MIYSDILLSNFLTCLSFYLWYSVYTLHFFDAMNKGWNYYIT